MRQPLSKQECRSNFEIRFKISKSWISITFNLKMGGYSLVPSL
ncbi:hypothetical protein SLEP1_g19685 [Rubroshorea leprosula]|uniref:Uncharacterized protein n=1 Tax=Rubroshorea leprosula TaxID=152421 RepID=A0AAV5JAS3_9ROSI|nr:hypothetical protein SLEP1_g19685 [Rubroshorea leprosula]